jgi:hypothetical protein
MFAFGLHQFERLLNALEKSATAVGSSVLPDTLTELDRVLTVVGREVWARVAARCEALLLERVLPLCGSLLLRELIASCFVKVLEEHAPALLS